MLVIQQTTENGNNKTAGDAQHAVLSGREGREAGKDMGCRTPPDSMSTLCETHVLYVRIFN